MEQRNLSYPKLIKTYANMQGKTLSLFELSLWKLLAYFTVHERFIFQEMNKQKIMLDERTIMEMNMIAEEHRNKALKLFSPNMKIRDCFSLLKNNLARDEKQIFMPSKINLNIH